MFKIDIKGLKELKGALDPKKFQRAAIRALNKSGGIAAQAGTAVSRAVSAEYNITNKRVKEGFHLRKANWESMSVVLTYFGRPPGLQHFAARKTRKGVTVSVIKKHGRKVVMNAFMADTPQGAPAVWKRTGEGLREMKAGRYKGKRREPIKRLHGPDIPAMVKTVGVDAAQKTVDEKAARLIAHEVERELKKK